jgi:hypothetical protein
MIASILREWSAKQGWNESSQIDLLVQYIDNQQDDAAFEDFLRETAEDETETETD